MTSTDIKTIELIVNSEQVKKRLDELNQWLTTMKQKREEALNKGDSRGLQVYTKEIQKIEREIRRTESRANTMTRAPHNLDRSAPNELKRTLAELNRELNSGRVQRGSAEWNTLTRAIRETKDAISQVNAEMRTVQRSSWSDRLAEWGNKWMGLVMNIQAAIQAINGVRQVLQQTVADFATMEEAMVQVRKYTGMTTDEVKELNEALKKIDTRTSLERLNELAGDAGKLGITAKDCPSTHRARSPARGERRYCTAHLAADRWHWRSVSRSHKRTARSRPWRNAVRIDAHRSDSPPAQRCSAPCISSRAKPPASRVRRWQRSHPRWCRSRRGRFAGR